MYQHFRQYEHFGIHKRVSKISDEKELARNYKVSLWSANNKRKNCKNFECHCKNKNASSDKVMPHDQMHWLKTMIFTHSRFNKAVDQHNYANNIKMIKGVHQLTLRPNMLISLIDQFTIFKWMD